MLFNSIEFLVFFPIVVLTYFIIAPRFRYILLLIASYYFYMSWNPKYALLISFSIVVTYFSAILLEKYSDNHRKQLICVWGSILLNLGILILYKYANFILENVDFLVRFLKADGIEMRLDWLLPVGISFYTFQALSYTLDVYYGKIKPERNILRYALFVSFFPQLVAGPIERSDRLLPQIQNIENIKVWNYERIHDGLLLMAWGLFQKLVIADRASIVVENVINHYREYGFVEISVALFLFAVQIYCDFGGYTNIAIGTAKVMGIDLMNNFKQPYLATSIKDFWGRWHISLTSWFTDYLYIPLGGNRKGILRKYINVFIVFAISGLWHGASWHFVVWGMLHALYQIIEDGGRRVARKRNFEYKHGLLYIYVKRIVVFILVDFAWLFFVSDSMECAIGIIMSAFSRLRKRGFSELGLPKIEMLFLLVMIIVLLIVDILKEHEISIIGLIKRQNIVVRWCIYYALLWTIIIFGIYGIGYDTGSFIYFQF